MRCSVFALVVVALGLSPAFAQSSAPHATEPAIRDVEAVMVSGVQPGPGMWKVSRGDHVMWVLGTLSPLPRRMEWESRDIERVIAQAQEVIWAPSLSVGAQVGLFRGALLATKALGARKNPGDAKLQDVVSSELYSRWLVLKKKYVGRDNGIEKWRPMFAAMELYEEAIDDSGMVVGGIIGPVLARTVKAHQVKQTSPTVKIVIKDPKVALAEFRASRLDDIDCFSKTLHRLESDLDTMRDRANAWAVGDIEALRSLPYSDQNEACMKAAMQAGAVRKRSTGDVEVEMEKQWFEAAEKALASNAVTFSTLSMRELLKPDGYMAKLQAKGYAVVAPE